MIHMLAFYLVRRVTENVNGEGNNVETRWIRPTPNGITRKIEHISQFNQDKTQRGRRKSFITTHSATLITLI